MVSVADEEGRLVLMGVDATYCVVDEVDTTSTINDRFLHQAIEDAKTTIKQEPVSQDSDSEDQQDDSSEESDDNFDNLSLQSFQTPKLTNDLEGQIELHHRNSLFITAEEDKAESSRKKRENEVCETGKNLTLSNSSVLRAVLQQEPVSLREPETSQLVSVGMLNPPSSETQTVEIIDSATGKTLPGPVLKRKGKQNSRSKSSPSRRNVSETVAKGEGDGGEEMEGKSSGADGEVSKTKRSREKPYQCGVCLRWFGCKSHVVEHMRTHTGEKPFQCPLCHKRFSQKSNIHQHMNTHTQQRPFRCDDCGKDFMYRGSLYKHKRLHTGERPYSCGLCQRRFTHASQLFEHLRTHTNERPFKCGVCGRAFAHSGTMHRHQRNHFSQAKGKGTVVGEGGVMSEGEEKSEGMNESSDADINHNTPSYRSQMDSQEDPELSHGDSDLSPRESNPNLDSLLDSKGPDRIQKQAGQTHNESNLLHKEPDHLLKIVDQSHKETNQLQRKLNPTSEQIMETDMMYKKEEEASPSSDLGKKSCAHQTKSLDEIATVQTKSSITNTPVKKRPTKTTPGKERSRTATETLCSFRSTSRKKQQSSGKSAPLEESSSSFMVNSSTTSSLPMEWSVSKASTSQSDIPTNAGVLYRSDPVKILSSKGLVVLGTEKISGIFSEKPVGISEEMSEVESLVAGQATNASVHEQNNATDVLLASSSISAHSGSTAQPHPSKHTSSAQLKSTSKVLTKRSTASGVEEGQKKKRTRLETPDRKIFSCDICGRAFCHRRSVKRHKLAVHSDTNKNNAEENMGSANKGKERENMGIGNSHQHGPECMNTSLLKSLLTLTAEQKKASGPQNLSDLGAQSPGGQPLGEASASLQAIAHLCVQGHMAPSNISQSVLTVSLKKGEAVSDMSQNVPQILLKQSPKNDDVTTDKNQNVLKIMLSNSDMDENVISSINQKMSKISHKDLHGIISDVSQDMHQKSPASSKKQTTENNIPSLGVKVESGCENDTGGISDDENHSGEEEKIEHSSLRDTFETLESVVVKLEPVDIIE